MNTLPTVSKNEIQFSHPQSAKKHAMEILKEHGVDDATKIVLARLESANTALTAEPTLFRVGFVDWLNDVLYEIDAERFFARLEIQ